MRLLLPHSGTEVHTMFPAPTASAGTDPPPINDREERKRVREQRQQTKNTLLAEKKRAARAALHQRQLEEHRCQEVPCLCMQCGCQKATTLYMT